MKINSLKGFIVWLFVALSPVQTLSGQGPRGGGFAPQWNPFVAPPPPPPPSIMRSCGDYVFVLQGATLYRFNAANSQRAGTISLLDPQSPQRPHSPMGLLIPAGGNGKAETLLVLLDNRLYVVNPSSFTKPSPIVLPEQRAAEKPDSRTPGSVGAGTGQQQSVPPTQPADMGTPPDPPGPGEQGPPPPPPMGPGEPGGHGFRPGPGQMPPPPPPQAELKGSKLFLIQDHRLLTVDYFSGDVKTIALQEQSKAAK